jgi:branched-chain amino acid aminotransferase
MHSYVLLNDQIVPADRAILFPGQLGLLAGWGVFTTLRIYQGVPFEFVRHYRRMSRDAELLHIDMRWTATEMRRHLLHLIETNKAHDATMRVCVVRSQGGFWAGPGTGNTADLLALTTDLPHWQHSVALAVAQQGRHAASPFAGTKTLSWAHNLTFVENANRDGFAEVVLLNERAEVAECTSCNIFAVKDGTTFTPPLNSGCLPGVTRAVMLEELRVSSAPVVEKSLSLEDLCEADEVFITSTTRQLLPVHQIADHALVADPQTATWPVMHALLEALNAYIHRYVQHARQAVA